MYGGLHLGLLGLAQRAEGNGHAYPYRSEDWLRYLLPTLFEDRDSGLILLAGESAVRENLVYERFERAFPQMRVVQGGLSLGTFDDVLVSLQYLERVYGKEALPEVLVMGVSPRFVANLPRDQSPLVAAINRYSPYYRVARTGNGSRIVEKGTLEGWLSRARFHLKQQARYRAALIALLRPYFREDVPYEEFYGDFERMRALRDALSLRPERIPAALDFVRDVGVTSAFGRWFRVYVSPYKYHYLEPMSRDDLRAWLLDPESFWVDVHSWDPDHDSSLVRTQMERLLALTRRCGISLYVVNLPENPVSRKLYRPEHYASYRKILLDSLGDTPFLDLREMLAENEFYDVVHATLPGALRVTDRVIRFVNNHGYDERVMADMGRRSSDR